MPSGINDDGPHRNFAHGEVEVDDEPDEAAAPKFAPVTWLVLGVSLALTVLLAKFGVWFLFLPIILPFGLGGRAIFKRAPSRRRIRLDGTVLSLEQGGFGGAHAGGSVDVSAGAFVSVAPSGTRSGGAGESVVRVVSIDGALEVRVADVTRARRVKARITDLLAAASVRSVDRTTPLQGGIVMRSFDDVEELEWARRRAGPWSPRGRTVLRTDADGWTLRVYSGWRLEASSGGPGRPEARLVTHERPDWAETGVVEQELTMELVWDGQVAARVGANLSEPELRFVVSRLERPQPGRLPAR